MAPRPESTQEAIQATLAAIFDRHRRRKQITARIVSPCTRYMLGQLRLAQRLTKRVQVPFIAAFLHMLSRVVVVMKTASVDRIIKFAPQYLRFVNEKGKATAFLEVLC